MDADARELIANLDSAAQSVGEMQEIFVGAELDDDVKSAVIVSLDTLRKNTNAVLRVLRS